MKVNIKDYQAIKNAELSFEPGITAIIGNSNNGKSSIIRAIESAINNKGGSGFINYDSKQAEVTIEDNGNVIKWIKNELSTKSYYDLNGEIINKIGQKQIPEVGELLNMREVEVNGERFRLNFWKQMEYPFLVGKTPYQLFDFISKSKEQEIISSLEDTTDTDLKDSSKSINTTSVQIDTKTSDIVAMEKDIAELEIFEEFDWLDLQDTNTDVDTLSNLIDTYESDEIVRKGLRSDYLEDSSKIEKLDGIITTVDKGKAFLDSLKFLLDTLEEDREDIEDNTSVLSKSTKDIKNVEKKISSIESIKLEIDSKINEKEEIKLAINAYNDVLGQIKTSDRYTISIEEKMSQVLEKLKEFKTCPLCGGSLDNCEVNHG